MTTFHMTHPIANGAAIESVSLTKEFKWVAAVKDVSFTLQSGEVLCVIGANGAGKTTLLYLLGGILLPSEGRLTVLGMDRWRDNFALRRRSTFVPAQPVFGASPTPFEYLRFVAQIYQLPENQFHARMEPMVEQFDFREQLHKEWKHLSLGHTKKAALMAGFLPDANLRIFDEPFAGGIDPVGMEALYRWIGERRSAGETIVFSTQVLEQAEINADKILVLESGRVVKFGTPEELLEAAGVQLDTPRALVKAYMHLTRHDAA